MAKQVLEYDDENADHLMVRTYAAWLSSLAKTARRKEEARLVSAIIYAPDGDVLDGMTPLAKQRMVKWLDVVIREEAQKTSTPLID